MSTAERANPYVGPYAFREEDADLFFGREREAESLVSLVIAESIVLFFAQSGTGKTSLLQAKLVPELCREGFEVLPVARVGGELPAGMAPTNVYVASALRSLAGPEADPARFQHLTLGAFLWTLPPPKDGKTRRVLLFDQFEEILTTHPQHWEQREDFFLQLRQALEDEPSLSILLVVREDNLAGLETYAPLLPRKLRTRFGMDSLRFEDALKAVRRPAELGNRPFEEGVAEQLVDDLRQVREGEGATYAGEFVEPMQLQVVCYQLWENLRTRPGETITAADLASCGKIDQALEGFYERSVREASQASGVAAERILRWCGKALITPRTRIRSQVSRERGATAGLRNEAVQALVATKLVREQAVRGGIWYELVHDRFIDPVLQVNERFQSAESTPLRRDVRLWDLAGRDASYLYRGQQLAEALAVSVSDPESLTDSEKAFLAKSQDVELKQAVRLRSLVLALGVLLAVAAVLAIYSFWASRRSASRELAARAVNLLVADPDQSLRLAVEAAETAATPEAEAALHAALNAARVRQFWWKPMKSANAVAFSPDGAHLAAVGDGGEAELWNVATGDRERALPGHMEAVNSVAFSPDGRWLATGDSAGNVIVRGAAGEPQGPALFLGAVNVNGLAFSPDGKILAIASDSPRPALWNFATGQRRDLPVGEGQEIWAVAFSSDGRFLATGDEDGRVVVSDLVKGTPPREIGRHSAPVTGVAFRPGEPPAILASSSRDGTARLWDLSSSRSEPLWGHKGEVWGLAFSSNGEYLATASFDHTAKLWDVSSKQERFWLAPGGAGEVVKVAFGPQPDLVATASHSPRSEERGTGVVTVWRVLFNDETPTLTLAQLRAANQKLATDLSVVPETEPWVPKRNDPSDVPVRAVARSADGKRLALARSDGITLVLDAATGRPFRTLSRHQGEVLAVTFSADGTRLATGSADQTSKLWDLERGSEIATFGGHGAPVTSVAFDAEDSVLATADKSGKVRLESLDVETLIARARARLAQSLPASQQP